jgi:putative endonuclease
MTGSVARRKAWRFGQFGELLCSIILRLKGYRILAQRYKTPVGEIDLIGSKGRLLIFVEVKSRRSRLKLEQPVSARQRRRIERAALSFIQHHSTYIDYAMRFDLMQVYPWSLPVHCVGAWRYRD